MEQIASEKIIREYFQSWIKKDPSVIEGYFSDDISYIECYGPEYKNKKQCLAWFKDWNQKGSVLEWTIKRIEHVGQTYVVEWFFNCELEGTIDGFDGVSIIEFLGDKICSVKEFQSKSQHYWPYEGI